MSSVFGRIQNFSTSLTPSEARIAEYLLQNPEQAMEESMQEVARKSGVSIASVSRLAVTLGYRDWKELRLNLARGASANGGDNPVFADITPEDTDDTVVAKVFNSNILSLRETLEQIDIDGIQKVVKAIKKADRIVFFGSGGAGCIAKDESLRFAHLEPSSDAYTEEFQMMLQASRMAKGQVAFGFSNSGRSRATVAVLAEARRNQALTVGIANFRNTPLEEVSDVFFCTSYPPRGAMTAAITARIAIQSIMDAIYVLSAHHGRIAAKVKYMNTLLESSLRIPSPGKNREVNTQGKGPSRR